MRDAEFHVSPIPHYPTPQPHPHSNVEEVACVFSFFSGKVFFRLLSREYFFREKLEKGVFLNQFPKIWDFPPQKFTKKLRRGGGGYDLYVNVFLEPSVASG